MTTEKKIDDGK